MLLNNSYLRSFPKIFRSLTSLDTSEFDDLVRDLLLRWEKAEHRRLARRHHQRAMGGGPHFDLSVTDQLSLTVIWLRRYPTHKVLGFLFGVSDTTAGRYIQCLLPLLEKSGRYTMRRPGSGRRSRRSLDDLCHEIPELKAVVIDTLE